MGIKKDQYWYLSIDHIPGLQFFIALVKQSIIIVNQVEQSVLSGKLL